MGVATNWLAVIYRLLASLYTVRCRKFCKTPTASGGHSQYGIHEFFFADLIGTN